jgi:hypothetical protein
MRETAILARPEARSGAASSGPAARRHGRSRRRRRMPQEIELRTHQVILTVVQGYRYVGNFSHALPFTPNSQEIYSSGAMLRGMRQTVQRLAALTSLAGASVAAGQRTISAEPKPRKRVLVTGFHDWHELEGNLWRCRDNPSCRLILGPPTNSPPLAREGALVTALATVDADFTYQTLPVIWGTTASLDVLSYDVVIHLGLGVYDNKESILVEQGAYNLRRGNDALGHEPLALTIETGAPEVQQSSGEMRERYAALAEEPRLPGGFVLRDAPARRANSFICNESHWRALSAQREAAGGIENKNGGNTRLRAAYFLHLPYAKADDHKELASAVAAVICRIVGLEH